MLNLTLLRYGRRSQTRKNMNSGTAWQLGWDIFICLQKVYLTWLHSRHRGIALLITNIIITRKTGGRPRPTFWKKNNIIFKFEPHRVETCQTVASAKELYPTASLQVLSTISFKTYSLGKPFHQSIMCNGNAVPNFGEKKNNFDYSSTGLI